MLLEDSCAEVDASDAEADTALQLACSKQHEGIARMLLQHGARKLPLGLRRLRRIRGPSGTPGKIWGYGGYGGLRWRTASVVRPGLRRIRVGYGAGQGYRAGQEATVGSRGYGATGLRRATGGYGAQGYGAYGAVTRLPGCLLPPDLLKLPRSG